MPEFTRTPIDQLTEKLSLFLPQTDYLPAFETKLKEYANKANIPGFRKGKVPASMIKKMYGQNLFADEVIKAADKALANYLQTEKIELLGQPLPIEEEKINLNADQPSDFTFFFEIGIKPAVDINLANIKVDSYDIQPSEEEVNEEIMRLRNSAGERTEAPFAENETDTLLTQSTLYTPSVSETENPKPLRLMLRQFTTSGIEKIKKQTVGSVIQVPITDLTLEYRETVLSEWGLKKDDAENSNIELGLEVTKIERTEPAPLDAVFF